MRVLVTGAGGQVGRELVRVAGERGLACVPYRHDELDITESATIEAALDAVARPGSLVVNLAAYTRVDEAETQVDAAFAVNAGGVAVLASACARRRLPMLHVSTDFVFDGTAQERYGEADAVRPLNVYGRSKAAGEDALRAALDEHLIVRTSWVFGAHGGNFVKTLLHLAERSGTVRVVADERGCPTGAAELAGTLLTLAERAAAPGFSQWGTYHYCGHPPLSRAAYARAVFQLAGSVGGLPTARVREIAGADFPAPAERPRNAVLACGRMARVFGIEQPAWRASLEVVLRELAEAGGLRARP